MRLFKRGGYAVLLKRLPTIHRTLAFKRMVVETLISESLSYPQTSVRFDHISPSTILQWRRLYERGLLDGPEETLTMTKKVYRPDISKPDSEKTPKELVRAEVAVLKKLQELRKKETLTQHLIKRATSKSDDITEN